MVQGTAAATATAVSPTPPSPGQHHPAGGLTGAVSLRRPYPIPRRRLERASRMLRAAAMAGLARSMAPRLGDMHPVSALRPEEDVFWFGDTGMLAVPVAAPGYLGWLQATDPTPGQRTSRRHLQALLADRPWRRPVLKSPLQLGRALAASAAADPARVHDVDHAALVADPLGEVERLDARLGLALSDPARQRTRRWIRRQHHRSRRHRYALADFGLDPAAVDRRFARYRDWVAAAT